MPLNFCQYLYEILINFHNPFIGHSSMLVEKQESQLTYKKLLFFFFFVIFFYFNCLLSIILCTIIYKWW